MHDYYLLRGRVGMWAEQLIDEYCEGREVLGDMLGELSVSELDQLDKAHINSMEESMAFSITWLESGRQPDTYGGADRRNIYRTKQYGDMDILPDITAELRKERKPLHIDKKKRQVLIQLFRSFSHRERQCYIMHEAEGMSMQKIAERLGIKKRTVQQYIERARVKVNEIVA